MLLLMCRFKYLITTSDPNVPKMAASPTIARIGAFSHKRIDPAKRDVKPFNTALAQITVHLS